MNRPSIALIAATLALLVLDAPALSATALSPQDSAFVIQAARGGAAEIADAKVALQTTRNSGVDAFANHMIDDHSKANAKLATIMQHLGIAAPAGLGAENQTMYSKLEALTGAAFDVAYIAGQKTAHQETIALFQHEIHSGHNAQLVAFAKATLPTVQSHMMMLTTGKL